MTHAVAAGAMGGTPLAPTCPDSRSLPSRPGSGGRRFLPDAQRRLVVHYTVGVEGVGIIGIHREAKFCRILDLMVVHTPGVQAGGAESIGQGICILD